MFLADYEGAFLLEEGQNRITDDLNRSVINGGDVEGGRGESAPSISVRDDVVDSDGAVEVVVR